METKLLQELFGHFVVIKMMHFQTASGFSHTKVDEYTTKFLANFDRLLEVWQGVYGVAKTDIIQIKVKMSNDGNFVKYLDAFSSFLNKDLAKIPREIAVVRDEMLADISQLIYLLSFK